MFSEDRACSIIYGRDLQTEKIQLTCEPDFTQPFLVFDGRGLKARKCVLSFQLQKSVD